MYEQNPRENESEPSCHRAYVVNPPNAERRSAGLTALVAGAPLLAYLVVTVVFWIIPGVWIIINSDEWLNPSAGGHLYSALSVSLLAGGSTSISGLGVMLLAMATPLVFLIPLRRICRMPRLSQGMEPESQCDLVVFSMVCAGVVVLAIMAFLPSIESFVGSQSGLGYAAQLDRRTAVSSMSSRATFLLNGALPWCLVAAAAMIATRRIWWIVVTIGISAVLILIALASGFKIPLFSAALGAVIVVATTYPNRKLVLTVLLVAVLVVSAMMVSGLGDISGVFNWIAFRTGDSLPFFASEASAGQPVGFDVLRMLTGYSTQASPHWNTIVFDVMYPLRFDNQAYGATAIPLVIGAWLDGGAVVGFSMAIVLGFVLTAIGLASTLPRHAASRASILSVGVVAGIWASQVQAHALLWQSYSVLGLAFLAALVLGAVWILRGRRPRLTRSKPQLTAAAIVCVSVLGMALLVVYAREKSTIVAELPRREHPLAWLYGDGLQPKMQAVYGLPAIEYGPQSLSAEVAGVPGGLQFMWDLQPEEDYELLIQGRQRDAAHIGLRIDLRDAAGETTSRWIRLGEKLPWEHRHRFLASEHLHVIVYSDRPNVLHLSTIQVRPISPLPVTETTGVLWVSSANINDFDGNGTADLIVRDCVSAINPNAVSAYYSTYGGGPPIYTEDIIKTSNMNGWSSIGFGDFDGDCDSDLLWSNDITGTFALWLMDTLLYPAKPYTTVPMDGTMIGFTPIGTGDFDGNGTIDILYQDHMTGGTVMWLMSNVIPGIYTQRPVSGSSPGPDWLLRGIGDLDGDGDADILWQRSLSAATNPGAVSCWLIDAAIPSSAPPYLPKAIYDSGIPGWQIYGLADWDANGSDDIIWKSDAVGNIATWQLGTVVGSTLNYTPAAISTSATVGWDVIGFGDYDGNGHVDLMWQSKSAGTLVYWAMTSNPAVYTPTEYSATDFNTAPLWIGNVLADND